MKDNYEKRRFIEMASVAMLVDDVKNISGNRRPVREIVNRASELWDEIEHQVPRDKDDR